MRIDHMIRSAKSRVAGNWQDPEKQKEARAELKRLRTCRLLLSQQIGSNQSIQEMENSFAELSQIPGGYSEEDWA